MEKRSGKQEWRCRKENGTKYIYRSKGTSSGKGRCLAVAGIGYGWAMRNGRWQCCSNTPLGEACKLFTTVVGSCPTGYKKRNTGNGNRVCRRKITQYKYSAPIWKN